MSKKSELINILEAYQNRLSAFKNNNSNKPISDQQLENFKATVQGYNEKAKSIIDNVFTEISESRKSNSIGRLNDTAIRLHLLIY